MNEFIKKESEYLGEKYYRRRHKSGLDIYFFPKDRITSYALLGVKYGSAHNGVSGVRGTSFPDYPDGIAHFLEHKLFENEDGSDSFEFFTKYGADSNAYTDYESTVYMFEAEKNFTKCLAELLKFVTNPYFTKESVEREAGIIAEEVKMYSDFPGERCIGALRECMYLQRGVRAEIAGTLELIKKITPEMLYDCHRTFYRPSNLVLVVCGRANRRRILELCDRFFPDAAGEEILRENPGRVEPRGVFKPYTEQKMQVSRPLFCIGIKDTDIPDTPVGRLEKQLCVGMLDLIIFSASGELFERLFDMQLLSEPLSFSYDVTESYAYAVIGGESDNPKKVLSEMKKYIKELISRGITPEEFAGARKMMLAHYVKDFDSPENIANNLFSYVADGTDIFESANSIKKITLPDLNRLIPDFFAADAVALSVVRPSKT